MARTTGRVSLVTTGLSFGGAEQQVATLARALHQRGWAAQVITLIDPVALHDTLREAGVPVVSLGMRKGVPDPRGLWWVRNALRQWRPDVVHGHMYHANLLTRLARPIAPEPVLISTAHNMDEGHGVWAYRLTDRLADLTTNVSHAAVTHYENVRAAPAARLRYVPNGVDTARFEVSDAVAAETRAALGLGDAPVLLHIGRFEEQKDHLNLLAALPALLERHPGTHLLLVGSGPLERAVRAEAARAGIEPHVHFLGARDDVPALMAAADGLVLSSRWEGLPMVLLEAGAAALPVVATEVGVNAETGENGVTGYLVPPREPHALGEALVRLLHLPAEERQALGAAARARVQREFAIDRVVDRWEEIYEELGARRRCRAAVGTSR
jgi:glycosyltransferase involved in cell wall biosynthesis